MPDRYQNKNVTSVADMLGEYLDIAMKRQDQFKNPQQRVDYQDEEGNWYRTTMRGREIRAGGKPTGGILIRPGEEKVNQYERLLSELGFAKKMNPNETKTSYLGTLAEGINSMQKGGLDLSPDMADNIIGNIQKTYAQPKEEFFNVEVTDPATGITTKRRVSGETLKKGVVTKSAKDTEKLQNANYQDEQKIKTLEADRGVEVGYEEPKKAIKKKGFLGIDRLAKATPPEEGYYWEMIDGEKFRISKEEYDSRRKTQTKADKYIPIFQARIKNRNKTMGVGEPTKSETTIEKEIPDVQQKYRDKYKVE